MITLADSVRARLNDAERLAALAHLDLLGTRREDAFDRLTRLATRLLRTPGALVTVTTDEIQSCKSSVGLPEPWASEGLPLTFGLCPYTVASGEPLLVTDARTDSRFFDNPGVLELGVVGYAGVPLLTADGLAIGAFCVFDDGPRTWTNEDVEILQDLAGAAMSEVELRAIATVAHASEAALREESVTLETINHIGRLLTAELDLDALVQAVTESATTLTGAHFGAFFYNALDARGEYYTLYAIAGVPREAFAQFPLPRNTALFGPTFRGEGIVRIPDVRRDPRFGHNSPYHGMPLGHLPVVSYLAVPVLGRNDDVLGGLFFGHPEVGIFDERAEQLAVGLAAQAAIAVENARLFQQAQDELDARRQVETAKVAFLDAVAHDLGNALMALKGQAQLLRRRANQGRADTEALESGLTAIDATVERASRLIHELTDVARLEAQHPLELKCIPTDLVTLARTSIEECQAAAPAHTLHLEAKVNELVGYWDADRVMRVLENLLANAVKYSPAGSTIEVQVARHDDTNGALAVLTVSDEGVGIPAADLPFIFERFRRGRNVEGQIVGTGLGLWGSQQIVAQHGGTIDITSAEGLGTTVTVRLPLEAPEEISNGTQPATSTAFLTSAVN